MPDYLHIAGSTVRIPGTRVSLEPRIGHMTRRPEVGFAGFDDPETTPVEHQLDCWVGPEDAGDQVAETVGRKLATLAGTSRGPPLYRERDASLRIATLTIDEYPAHFLDVVGGEWPAWLTGRYNPDGSMRALIEVFTALEMDDTGALSEGGLLFCRTLEVHPAFHGQDIGLRLLAHGLSALHRSIYDVAILEAMPMTTAYTAAGLLARRRRPRAVPGSARPAKLAATQRLVAHYARLGFLPVTTAPPDTKASCTMYLWFGTVVPVTGLGQLGVDANPPMT